LGALRIENMKASRPEDIVEILAAIPDKVAFNDQLQALLFENLIPNWNNLDVQEQMVVIGRIALSDQKYFGGSASTSGAS